MVIKMSKKKTLLGLINLLGKDVNKEEAQTEEPNEGEGQGEGGQQQETQQQQQQDPANP